MKIKYTCDFINTKNIKNKLIEVDASNEVEAKEKILTLLSKINGEIIKVRPVNERDYD
tara:strand:- start:346 stop:519 length:174 start_codon:yes stop_codon:yes gene_type:complete